MNKGNMRQILQDLEKAREAATMERASFHRADGSFIGQEVYTNEIREATRLYRDTWIVYPIDTAIASLKKELAK